MTTDYATFLAGKSPAVPPVGLSAVLALPAQMRPFQQLAWARAVCDAIDSRCFVLTPLAGIYKL